MRFLLATSIGIFSVAWWPQLPDFIGYLGLISVLSIIVGCGFLRWRLNKILSGAPRSVVCFVLCFAWGSLWGVWSGYRLMSHQLPAHMDTQVLSLTGTVSGLVHSDERRSRFSLAVDTVEQNSHLRRVLLSWYSQKEHRQKLRSGDYCQFSVRLRRPRGMLNPGGFDYQGWLLRQGFSATGTVTGAVQDCRKGHRLISRLDRWRGDIVERINQMALHNTGVILALSVGDKQQLTQQWDNLTRLGIVHLLVISGLHIGLVAILGSWLGSAIVRLSGLYAESMLGHWLPPLSGLLIAFYYSLLAGFSLSSQRALIAVALVVLAKLLYRRIVPISCLVWALCLIALSQPLATLDAGFWFSFIAVGLLLFWFLPWYPKSGKTSLRSMIAAQVALMLVLLVPNLVFVGKASWLAPLVNVLAVPWVSLFVVPVCLLASLVCFFAPELADVLWRLADISISALWWLLQQIPQSVGLLTSPVVISPWLLLAAVLAVFGLLMPRGLRGKTLCCLPLCIALLAPERQSPLRLTVLDMGQGLGLVLETQSRTLVYDTGARYSTTFNGGSGIIVPYLRSRGIDHIDLLVVSHGDGDHAGGYHGLVDAIAVEQGVYGADFSPSIPLGPKQIKCRSGQRWTWQHQSQGFLLFKPVTDTVWLSILSPTADNQSVGNNSSCVMLIEWRDQRILLPGDIEATAEALVIAELSKPVTVLLAPHHGSKTSSTVEFVNTVRPQHVVFSAGYRHHFGHPHGQVVVRYSEAGSRLWNTAEQGALSFIWDSSGDLHITSARDNGWRFWWR